MVKKILSLFVTLLLLVGGSANAAEMRIWQSASSQGLPSFYKAMESNGWAIAGSGFRVDALTHLAFEHAKTNKLVSDDQRDEFAKLFRERNGLQAETISVEQFTTIGAGKGFYVGSLADLGRVTNSTVVPPVAKETVSTEVADIERLRGEVIALSNKEGKTSQDVALLTSKLDMLNKSLQEGQKQATSLATRVDAAVKQFKSIDATIDQKVKTQVDDSVEPMKVVTLGLAQRFSQLQENFKTLVTQGKKVDALVAVVDKTIVYTMTGFGLVTIALIFLAFKQGAVGKKVIRLEKGFTGFTPKMEGIRRQIGDLGQDVKELTERTAELSDVQFAPDNVGLMELELLSYGREYAVSWKGRCGEDVFVVNIWKDITTPEGQVQTDIVRNMKSKQLSEPVALKRLTRRIEVAVRDGRIKLIRPVTLTTKLAA